MIQINPEYISKISQSPYSLTDAFRSHVQIKEMDWFPKSNGLILPNGFKVVDNKPLDARNHVMCLEDLKIWRPTMQGFPYVGMSVLVIFKHRYSSDGSVEVNPMDHTNTDWGATQQPENLLLQRYVCVSIEGKKGGAGETMELTVSNNDGSDTDNIWTFEMDNWVAEKAEASGFADGIFVYPSKSQFNYFKQTDPDGNVTYWKTNLETGEAKAILWSETGAHVDAKVIESLVGRGNYIAEAGDNDNPGGVWKNIYINQADPTTGAVTKKYAASAEEAFGIILSNEAPPTSLIEANEDNQALTVLAISRESTDVMGRPVVKEERVVVKNQLAVSNVVSMKAANTKYDGGILGEKEDDSNKYIRVTEAIGTGAGEKDKDGNTVATGADYDRPVYTIAKVGGKEINLGVSLEWAEWEQA